MSADRASSTDQELRSTSQQQQQQWTAAFSAALLCPRKPQSGQPASLSEQLDGSGQLAIQAELEQRRAQYGFEFEPEPEEEDEEPVLGQFWPEPAEQQPDFSCDLASLAGNVEAALEPSMQLGQFIGSPTPEPICMDQQQQQRSVEGQQYPEGQKQVALFSRSSSLSLGSLSRSTSMSSSSHCSTTPPSTSSSPTTTSCLLSVGSRRPSHFGQLYRPNRKPRESSRNRIDLSASGQAGAHQPGE